jgi:hypothetical protein
MALRLGAPSASVRVVAGCAGIEVVEDKGNDKTGIEKYFLSKMLKLMRCTTSREYIMSFFFWPGQVTFSTSMEEWKIERVGSQCGLWPPQVLLRIIR